MMVMRELGRMVARLADAGSIRKMNCKINLDTIFADYSRHVVIPPLRRLLILEHLSLLLIQRRIFVS